jgi:hypothetical protein
MGISISVLMASDDQICDFSAQPSQLEDLLNGTITIPYITEDCCPWQTAGTGFIIC